MTDELGDAVVVRIARWDKNNAKAGTRKVRGDVLPWYAQPTNVACGPVMRTLKRLEHGPAIALLFFELCTLAARSPVRGEVRCEGSGVPMSVELIADATGTPESVVRHALEQLADRRVRLIELVEAVELDETTSEETTPPLFAARSQKSGATKQDSTEHTTTTSKACSDERAPEPAPRPPDGGGGRSAGGDLAEAERALASVGVNEPGRWARSAASPRVAIYAACKASERARQGAKNPAGIAVNAIKAREGPPPGWRTPMERAAERRRAHDEQQRVQDDERRCAAEARARDKTERALIEAHRDIADQAVERAIASAVGFRRRHLERLSPDARRRNPAVRDEVMRAIARAGALG